MKTLHRIVSAMGLALLLSVALISLGNAPGAAAEPVDVAAATANAGWEEMGAGSASGGGISNNPGVSGYPSLALAPDGNSVTAWQDNSGGNLEIYVKRWDGSKWVEMGSGSATGGGISNNPGYSENPSLAIDPDGKAVVAWQDDSGSKYKPEIYVKRWDGSKWVEMGSGSATGGGISNNAGFSEVPSLAIDPDGKAVVAWEDDSSGVQIYVKRWNGSAWVEMGAGSASGGGISDTAGFSFFLSLAIGPDGTPVVAWTDSSTGSFEIYVKRWNGSAWVEMGAGSASGGGISNTAGSSAHPSLAIGSDGMPVVAWENSGSGNIEVYVKRWNGSAWVEMGAGSASGGGISQNNGVSGDPSLAIGPDGVPVVAWQDNSGGNREIYARRYAGEQSPPLAFRSFIPAAFYKP